MSLIGAHRASRGAGIVAVHRFHGEYDPKKREIYVFHEGDDDPSLYVSCIQNLGQAIKLICYRCGNKDAVFAAYTHINWADVPRNRLLFFVDKDLDDFLGTIYPEDENIFTTEVYSVENYLVNADLFLRAAREVAHLQLSKAEEDDLRRFFDGKRADAIDLLSPICHWVLAARRKNGVRGVDLSGVKMSACIAFRDDGSAYLRQIEGGTQEWEAYLASKTKVEAPPSKEEIESEREFLAGSEPKTFIRGKWELWWMVQLFESVRRQAASFCKAHRGTTGAKTNLTWTNAVEVLAPRSICPSRLHSFLMTNLLAAGLIPRVAEIASDTAPPRNG